METTLSEWFLIVAYIICLGSGFLVAHTYFSYKYDALKLLNLTKENERLKNERDKNKFEQKQVILSMVDSWEELAEKNKQGFSQEAKQHTIEAISSFYDS